MTERRGATRVRRADVRHIAGPFILAAALTACAGGGPHTVNLMPAPEVFADGAIDPLPKGQPPVSYDDFQMLYATDRHPADPPDQDPFYLNQAGHVVKLGRARVKASEPGLGWEDVRRISLASTRDTDYPLQVLSVDETGILDNTYTAITRPHPAPHVADTTGQRFATLVNERLAVSGVKDIFVYVHGYRVVFTNPLLISAELWHFLGYRGAFVAYAWRSTPRALAYASDSEAAITNGRKFRLFLSYLAENTKAERIHIIAYSAGSRMVVRALEQLALLNADASDEKIRRDLRLGNVVFVGADVSRRGFGAGLADGMLRIPKRTVVYVSTADRALNWSERIFRRARLGQMWTDDVPPRLADFMHDNPALEVIDVTDAAGSTTGNGHAYFRDSPWVSSDILSLLAYDMSPAERGLMQNAETGVWAFPPDYIERLRKGIRGRYPSQANVHGRPGDLCVTTDDVPLEVRTGCGHPGTGTLHSEARQIP